MFALYLQIDISLQEASSGTLRAIQVGLAVSEKPRCPRKPAVASDVLFFFFFSAREAKSVNIGKHAPRLAPETTIVLTSSRSQRGDSETR